MLFEVCRTEIYILEYHKIQINVSKLIIKGKQTPLEIEGHSF